MIEISLVSLLFISGLGWRWREIGKIASLLTCVGFAAAAWIGVDEHWQIPWLWLLEFKWHPSIDWVCAVVCFILSILHFVSRIFTDVGYRLGLLNIFAAFVCLCLASDNLMTFFVCVEGMSWLSVSFVWLERAGHETVKVFVFNAFASVLMLVGIWMSDRPGAALLIALACLCKGAQFPFSSWLLVATKAHSLASVFIHCVSIVGIGVICFQKFNILDEAARLVVLWSGIISSIMFPIRALGKTNVKEIIACLTVSSVGIMFMLCGLGYNDSSFQYFVIHAFYKSILFLYYIYVMEKCGTKNIAELKSGSVVLGLVATLSAAGCPPFVGFFGEMVANSCLSSSHWGHLCMAGNLANGIVIWRLFLSTTGRGGKRLEYVWPIWILIAGSAVIGVAACPLESSELWRPIWLNVLGYAVAKYLPEVSTVRRVPEVLLSLCDHMTSWICRPIRGFEILLNNLSFRYPYKLALVLGRGEDGKFEYEVWWVIAGVGLVIVWNLL